MARIAQGKVPRRGTYDAAEDPQERRRAAYPLAEEQVRGIMAGEQRKKEREREMSFRRILHGH